MYEILRSMSKSLLGHGPTSTHTHWVDMAGAGRREHVFLDEALQGPGRDVGACISEPPQGACHREEMFLCI